MITYFDNEDETKMDESLPKDSSRSENNIPSQTSKTQSSYKSTVKGSSKLSSKVVQKLLSDRADRLSQRTKSDGDILFTAELQHPIKPDSQSDSGDRDYIKTKVQFEKKSTYAQVGSSPKSPKRQPAGGLTKIPLNGGNLFNDSALYNTHHTRNLAEDD